MRFKSCATAALLSSLLQRAYGEPRSDFAYSPFSKFFIVSHIDDGDVDWCIEASLGTSNNKELRLRQCDYDNAPLEQLWLPDEMGMIHSALDEDWSEGYPPTYPKCMVNGLSNTLFDTQMRVRIVDCDAGRDMMYFTYDTDTMHLQVRDVPDPNTGTCVTNQGRTPEPTDQIIVRECQGKDRFRWSFVEQNFAQGGGYTPLVLDNPEGSDQWCMELPDGDTTNTNEIRLHECDWEEGKPEQMWRFDVLGRIHSQVDDDKCMWAGYGSGLGVDVGDSSTRIRINDCDLDYPDVFRAEKYFDHWWPGPDTITLKGYDGKYCITHHGVEPEAGARIKLVECKDKQRFQWYDGD